MSEKAQLSVINAGQAPRRGVVVTKWAPIRAALGLDDARAVRVFDGERRLAAQIDRIDPDDPEQDELAILLENDVPVSAEPPPALRVEAGDDDAATAVVTATAAGGGVKIENAALSLWLNCTPDLGGWGNWFAGAVTSVQLHGQQLLDFVAWSFSLPHEREKRCMQVDQLQIPRPPWHDAPFVEPRLYNRPWRIVSATSGAVRATVTVASPEFEVAAAPAPEAAAERFTCSLYRTLALNAEADAVRETMWLNVRGVAVPGAFWFSPHYFMFADFGLQASLVRPSGEQLIVSANFSQPPYGYALAANAPVDDVRNPPADFPDQKREHRAFAWKLAFSRRIEAVHLFSLQPPEALTDEIGALWSDEIDKPLRVVVPR